MNMKDRREVTQRMSSIRFGVMCNGTTLTEWQARCLKRLLEHDNIHAALLILDDSSVSKSLFSRVFTKLRKLNLKTLLFQFYSYFIARPHSFRPVDMTSAFTDVPSIRCKVSKRGKYSEYFNQEDIDRIRQFDLDFILRFGFNIIRGDILNTARYGVWSFHHDDEMKYRGSPPCFWEIYYGDPITGAILQRIIDRLDGGIVLRKGFLPTIPYSYAANLNMVVSESSYWPAQVCVDIFNGNSEYLNAPPSQTTAPIYRAPTSFQMVLFLLKLLKNFIIKLYNHFFCHEEWNIGIIREPISTLLKTEVSPTIQWLPKPERNHFLADPFGISRGHKIYILCENFDYVSSKAVISSIELTESGSIVKQEVAISEPFHLSYPFLFEYKDEFYCVPETAQTREVRLYKAEHFPSHWAKVATLIEDFPGVDSTVFRYGDRWWLTCANEEDGKKYKLFIWHAPNLFGPWEPHELNPVKVDVRSARPAGTPFLSDGYLYRPAQDCSVTYGGRVVFNRVVRLTPTTLEEESVWDIGPSRNSRYRDGLHTVSMAGDVTVVDGKRYLFLTRGFIHACSHAFYKIIPTRRKAIDSRDNG